MKNKQILVVGLILSIMFLFLLQNVSAAANTEIKNGKYTFETRFENKKAYASCSIGGQMDSHVNFVVYKNGKKIANWHIGKDTNEACIVATDSVSKECKRMCYDGTQKCAAKVGDILDIIGISNSNMKAIQDSNGAIKDFGSINMCKGSSPYIAKAPNLFKGGQLFIVGATIAMVFTIAKILAVAAGTLIFI